MTHNLKLSPQKPKQSIKERSPFANDKKAYAHKVNRSMLDISDVWIVIEYEEYFRQTYMHSAKS